jgi:hypothetical protein
MKMKFAENQDEHLRDAILQQKVGESLRMLSKKLKGSDILKDFTETQIFNRLAKIKRKGS